MERLSVPEGESGRLHDLIDRALAGDEVVITRDGKPIAELRPVSPAEPEVGSLEWLRKRAMSRPSVTTSSVEILREMYEDDD